MFLRLISCILSLALIASPIASFAAETMVLTNNISNEHGTLLTWQENGTRHFRSKYVAPNGVVIGIDVNQNRLTASIGNKEIKSTRNANGDIQVVYKNGARTEVLNFTAEEIAAAPKVSPTELLSDRNLATLTDEELAAFEALTAFAQDYQVPGLRCALNLAAFYLITGGAIAGCIGSGGLLCVVGVAGAYQSFDAALTACGSGD